MVHQPKGSPLNPVQMQLLGGLLVLCALAGQGRCADASIDWCYQDASCGPATWPVSLAVEFCNGSRQSPININSSKAVEDAELVGFSFTDYDNKLGLTKIKNTGKTVKVTLANGTVSGGGLPNSTYQSLQFHLHWGNGSTQPGSEHTVNGKRYPMEMHIVNVKAIYNGNTTLAVADNESIAALGFFLEELDGPATMASTYWDTLASYLPNITNGGEYANFTDKISLDDLLEGVDRTKYYRYLGSLTTPSCNEVVIWTVFKESIKVSKEAIALFSSTVRVANGTSALLLNTYRPIQPDQAIRTNARPTTTTTTAAASSGSSVTLAAAQMAIAALWAFKGV
ncbi:unnamed protein product [Gadus morhua 'NCC']